MEGLAELRVDQRLGQVKWLEAVGRGTREVECVQDRRGQEGAEV